MEIIGSDGDFITSVRKALTEIEPDWEDYQGMIAIGSHAPRDVEEKLTRIRYAREKNIPFLGICMGLQFAVIEVARNVWNIPDATTEEIGAGTHVVKKLPALRVGALPVWWGGGVMTIESHWHHYAVSNQYIPQLQVSGFDVQSSQDVIEIIKLKGHPFFIAVQFHPEYQSSKVNPHDLLKAFLAASKHATVAL